MGGKWLAKLAQNALREGRFMFQRHCERSEAIHSYLRSWCGMDCFASLAMTLRESDARNDKEGEKR
jgi:hypothetical protein